MARNRLTFPNASRSYDAKQDRVRFWAYDNAVEVSFFVDAAALGSIAESVTRDEHGLLAAFDLYRERICKAADRMYSRHARGSYLLMTADLH